MPTESQSFDPLRAELQSHGFQLLTASVDRDVVARVAATLGLPPSMADTYAQGGPSPESSIPWVVEDLTLYSITELVAAQEGYRWTGPTQRELPDWPANWVVVGSIFADPFFVDVADDEAPVYFARHGAGRWDAHRVAPSLSDFIAALTSFEAVLLGEFHDDVWDDAGLRKDFLRAIEVRLAPKLASTDLQAFVSTLL